jgi:hypothetical protein
MTTYTVSTDEINSPEAAAHFSKADHRVLRGIRYVCETLAIPIPDYAQRKVPGRPPSRVIAAAYAANNQRQPTGAPRYQRHQPASAERVAAAKQRQAERFGVADNS